MKGDKVMRLRSMAISVCLIVTLAGITASISYAQISQDVLQQAVLRTVKIFTPVGDTDRGAGCSGSFVNPNGLILTAAHCIRDPRTGGLYNPKGLAVIFMNFPDRVNPIPVLVAQRLVDNPGLDVALLRTVALFGQGESKPLPPDFRVPYLMIGDSDALRIGDPVAALGFPSLGGASITATQGHVTGFDADANNVKTWLKHDAPTTHGHSGGPIINGVGQVIAVVSHGAVDPSSAASIAHDALTSRIPLPWGQYFQGGIGSGQQSGPTTASAAGSGSAGAVLQGRVVDADSGVGIAGAFFVIFRPGTNLDAPQKSDIVAGAQTDGNGAFRTNPPVRKGTTYLAVAVAKGYTRAEGNLEIGDNDPDVIRLGTIQLYGQ